MVTVKLITATCAHSSGEKCGLPMRVVMYMRNVSVYSHSLSARQTFQPRPERWMSLSSTGSRIGSRTSPTF